MHVVEHPALENLLEEWAAAADEKEKEAAEKKIDDIFYEVDVKVLFIQVGDRKRQQLSRIVKEWNRGGNNKGEWNCLIFLISIGNENLSKCSYQSSFSPPAQQHISICDKDLLQQQISFPVLLLPSNTTTSGNNWSDRHLVANGQPLTGIKVKKSYRYGVISRIKAR